MPSRTFLRALSVALMPLAAAPLGAQSLPQYDHIVVVIDENKNTQEIRGDAVNAPYINNVLIPNSADLNNLVAETHPSQPNYLHFFSGSNQGVTQDGLPGTPAEPGTLAAPPPFTTPNLGREVINAGKSFATFSESLPYSLPGNPMVAVAPGTPGATAYGYTGEINNPTAPGINEYARKHNPASDWQRPDASAANNGLLSITNQPFTAFGTAPADFTKLPAVSFVIPNEQNDMHDGSIKQGDAWLQNNIEPYRQWALSHNSLLIYTFDESDLQAVQNDPQNLILALVSGAHIKNGAYSETAISRLLGTNATTAINHYNLLDTIETLAGTAHDATAVGAANPNTGGSVQPITDIFAASPAPEPGTLALLAAGAAVLAVAFIRRHPAVQPRRG